MADNIEEWVREGEIQETAREKHELMEQGPNTLEACVQAGPHNPARLPYQQSSSLTVFNFSLPPILSFPPLLMVQGQGSVQPLRAWCLCCGKHFSNVLRCHASISRCMRLRTFHQTPWDYGPCVPHHLRPYFYLLSACLTAHPLNHPVCRNFLIRKMAFSRFVVASV